jgi:superfamily II DNA or RNA helicase
MQSLKEDLRDTFSARTRERGAEYFAAGRVRVRSLSEDEIIADVQGSETYQVTFEFWDDEYYGDCTCPFAEDGNNCKHMWATILAIDAKLLEGNSSAGPTWKRELSAVQHAFQRQGAGSQNIPLGASRRVAFFLDADASHVSGSLVLALRVETLGKNGQWGRPRRGQNIQPVDLLLESADPNERLIGQLLKGSTGGHNYSSYHLGRDASYALGQRHVDPLLRLVAQTGRLALRHHDNEDDPTPVTVDLDSPWSFVLHDEPVENEPDNFYLTGSFVRDGKRMAISEPLLTLNDGFLIHRHTLARLDHGGAWPLLAHLRGAKRWLVHKSHSKDFLSELTSLPRLPRLEFSESLGIRTVDAPLTKVLRLARPDMNGAGSQIQGSPVFEYGTVSVAAMQSKTARLDPSSGDLLVRRVNEERDAIEELRAVGFEDVRNDPGQMRLHQSKLHPAVITLNHRGWRVEADGALFRTRAKIDIRVSSGIDWFELDGAVDFDGKTVAFPRVLQAMSRGDKSITLDDGSIGILPEEWLERYGVIAKLGAKSNGVLKFGKAQVGLLDAMLATMPEATVDDVFDSARRQLQEFSGVQSAEAPEGFVGELRPYQKDGLGWLGFLQKFGFGGCLADDMGLGKTIQVLALLESERARQCGPSLVVAPRSLVFNWIEEAKRFTPQLRVLDQSGAARSRTIEGWKDFDLVLTTYGTLRRDVQQYQDIEFNYAILDEAQAIKNASTDSAKAARLIRAKHRLALSGTPVENHIGELWSIFEYLNPGMLGSSGAFKSLIGRETAPESRKILAHALRPFILRRTKSQVARDLPAKTEQTIYCDLDGPQRKLYDELRDYYRAHLLKQVDDVGLNKSKMMVLESLLRLRQTACHPALVDEKHSKIESAKINTLLEQLDDVLQEGHKALVFSQFTSFLSLVKKRLDEKKVVYEYLDGQTRDRQSRVKRFQSDEECKLFLISLKAGGTGLNLTAADYVFLLDPWWNPAVEAQAIDRTHRIGQVRKVFAYRIIARGTVEERVLELQKTKRDLADAIVNADNSLISSLKREDLELLLS